MDVRLLFPSLYLGAADLRGRDVDLTIARVVVESLKSERGEERKPCMYFVETKASAQRTGEKEKRLVLNRTNAMTVAAMHGMEVDNWAGKRVTLYAAQVQAFGQTKDAIRVRPTAPAPHTAPKPETET